jgi:steroid 5-alpha reductase family enzyme
MPELAIPAQIAWIAAGAGALMLGLWAWQQRTRDAGIVDAGWAFGIAAGAVFCALSAGGDRWAAALAGLLGGVWGCRLAWHLLADRVIGRGEDGRYAAMRAALGRHAGAGFLAFFLVQAGLVTLFALPFAILAADPRPPGWHTALGGAIWLVAVGGEIIADRQLARWRADPANRGRTCRRGLWAWSRHPNYFCEWLHWWAYVAIGLGAPHGAWLLLWPPLMFAFLWWITGIPHTERRCLASRGDDYRAYQRSVPVFFPRPPRAEA